MFRKGRRKLASREDGQSTLEIALLMPMLLLMVTGMTSFGFTIRNYSILTDATSLASRQLAISRGQTTDPCATVVSAVTQAAPSLTQSSMTYTTDIYSGASHWQYVGTSCSGPNTYSGAPGNLLFQGVVRVTVTYPCSLWRYGNSGVCSLTASTAQVIQ
jgi:Flp pilus assembly protein TadG